MNENRRRIIKIASPGKDARIYLKVKRRWYQWWKKDLLIYFIAKDNLVVFDSVGAHHFDLDSAYIVFEGKKEAFPLREKCEVLHE